MTLIYLLLRARPKTVTKTRARVTGTGTGPKSRSKSRECADMQLRRKDGNPTSLNVSARSLTGHRSSVGPPASRCTPDLVYSSQWLQEHQDTIPQARTHVSENKVLKPSVHPGDGRAT